MAHAAKLSALTDELVLLLSATSAKSDPTKLSIHRESALRALRYHNYPRTNQFDVANRLDGLEEKFRVYNEDPLADALRERLNVLSKMEAKWIPEVLHLLLELSDKPVSKSKIEDLDILNEADPDIGPPLRWNDIIADDPLLQDTSVWRNVDFGAESSDGDDGFEDYQSMHSDLTESTVSSSVDVSSNRRPEVHLVKCIGNDELEKLRKAQFWQRTPNVEGIKLESVKKPITEFQAVREVLFMFSGFPTSLFELHPQNGAVIQVSKQYALKHASSEIFGDIATAFADQGSEVMALRSWASQRQSVPLLQILQSTITERILEFDKHLSVIQQRYVSPARDVVVSLIGVQVELGPYLRPLIRLSDITKRLDAEPYTHAFRYLEMLYDETCTSQVAGDDEMYSFMGKVFFECFQVYLRPIRTWMEDGELRKEGNGFFISETVGDVEPAALWQSRFKIRKTTGGILHGPKFLHPAATRIFTTGKSVVVLKHLNQFPSRNSCSIALEPTLDFDTVCNTSGLHLAPFPELFEVAFDAWIYTKHQHTSVTFQKILFDSCGLHNSLDALSHIYFMADGAVAAAYADAVFSKLDKLSTAWNDRFTLSELAQSTFGTLPSVTADRLRTSVLTLSRKDRNVERCRRSVKALAVIQLKYHLSWPIQIIVTPATIPSYQKVFTFLLQIRRSCHILSRSRLVHEERSDANHTAERDSYLSVRGRILWFNNTLYYYVTALVIGPNSEAMREDLKAAKDVDAMIDIHAAYIKSTIDKALLGSKLDLIYKTVLKILDQGIQLKNAQAASDVANKEALEQHQELMDLSMASLGLNTPKRGPHGTKSGRKIRKDMRNETNTASSSDDDDLDEIDVDLSILSATYDNEKQNMQYLEKLQVMKGEFDRLVRFVASGLRGVARASGGEEAKSWDILGDMLESGLGPGTAA